MKNQEAVICCELWELMVDPEWKTEEPVKRGTVSSEPFVTDHLPRMGETLSLQDSEGTTVGGVVEEIETRMDFSTCGTYKNEAGVVLQVNSLVLIRLKPLHVAEGALERFRENMAALGLKNWQEA